MNNLSNNKVKYDVICNLMDDEIFFEKMLVIFDNKRHKTSIIYNLIKENLNKASNILINLEKIEDYYNTFYKLSKKYIINLIKLSLHNAKENTLDNIINYDFIKSLGNNFNFNFNEAIKEAEKIKYKYSLFFMVIYNKAIKTKIVNIFNEHDIFLKSIDDYRNTITKIINQKYTKEPFFNIPNINEIMNIVKEKTYNLKEEINFIAKEFNELNHDIYIETDLLNDLIMYSNKEKI